MEFGIGAALVRYRVIRAARRSDLRR